jgi:hypothetical protein
MNNKHIYKISYNSYTKSYEVSLTNHTIIDTPQLYVVSANIYDDSNYTFLVFVERVSPEQAFMCAKSLFDEHEVCNAKIETVKDLKPLIYEMLEIMKEMNSCIPVEDELNDRLGNLIRRFR